MEIPVECKSIKFHDGAVIKICDTHPGSKSYVNLELSGCEAIKIKVDGCLPIKGKKCDWAVQLLKKQSERGKTTGSKFILIELKGKRFFDALEQLTNTILWMQGNIPGCQFRVCYIVMTRTIPQIKTRIANEKIRFHQQHNFPLETCNSGKSLKLIHE